MSGATIDEQMKALEQMKQQIAEKEKQITAVGQQTSASPTWDAIDDFTGAMTEREFAYASACDVYKESAAAIDALVAQQTLRMVLPMVEATKEGKEALTKHLELLKKLKKSAADEMDKDMAAWREYTEKYSHMTWKQYQDQKARQ